MPSILCIGGSDPGRGAGVQMDRAVCRALGVKSKSVVTVDTHQTKRGLVSAKPQSMRKVADKVLLALDDGVAAIKIGALGNEAVVEAVVAALEPWHGQIPIVLDPVCTATRTAGDARLNTVKGARCMEQELFPLSRLVTPNTFEYGTGERYENANAVLLKGGHADLSALEGGEESEWVGDLLMDPETGHLEFRHPRIPGASELHGTGCALSTAIACLLAKGYAAWEACQVAIELMHGWMKESVEAGRLITLPPTSLPPVQERPTDGTPPVMWLCS